MKTFLITLYAYFFIQVSHPERIGMYLSPSTGTIKFVPSVTLSMTGWQSIIHWRLRNWNSGAFAEHFSLTAPK